MPKTNKPLTDLEIKGIQPEKDKDYYVYDTEGMRIIVRKSGSKVFQYPYKHNGKYNICTIGKFKDSNAKDGIGAKEARERLREVKALIKEGIDPNRAKKQRKQENIDKSGQTFKAITQDWLERQTWIPKHKKNVERTFEADVFKFIGDIQIDEVTPMDIVGVIQRIEDRNALDVAKRVNQRCAAVFDYAMNKGLCDSNPALGRAKFIKDYERKHRPYLKEHQLPEFLYKLENYTGSKLVKLAMKMLMLSMLRPGELRNLRWDYVEEKNNLIRIPKEAMKKKKNQAAREHVVHLSSQAKEILEELKPLSGQTELLFPGERSPHRPISDVTLTKVLRTLGYTKDSGKHAVPHGMRATASTILNEKKFNKDAIERQLAHYEDNKVRAAYHHSEYHDERKKMLQWYADHLDMLKNSYDEQD